VEEEEEEEGTVGEGAEADIVEEVNGVYVFFSFVLTTTTGALSVCRGILYDRLFFRIMTLIAPIASLSLVLAFFCKPKRTDAAYKVREEARSCSLSTNSNTVRGHSNSYVFTAPQHVFCMNLVL
jgi:hypothetical protein